MELQDYRKQIDEIDNDLVRLFLKRLDISSKIASYKNEHQLPVFDAERERQLLNRVSDMAGENNETYVRLLYTTLMGLSRAKQIKQLHNYTDSPLAVQIKKAIENTPRLFPERAVVACQGVEGAYSQQACDKLFNLPNIIYCSSFDGVCRAVENGLCRYGILPLENTTAGSVNQVYTLMTQYRFSIVRSTRLKISHALLVKKGTRLEDIREIYSHQQAISQCSNFLQTLPNARVIPCENTAIAAKRTASSANIGTAAIASPSCAALYGLDCIASSIQDNGGNFTRFICISKETEIYPGSDKTSIMLRVPHKPGALFQVLSRFYELGINITKLESRPIPDSDFEFTFYFDMATPVYTPALIQLLCELEAETEGFCYLGSYQETV